jgi:secondary thiamine-phosphate synthase enzyme
MYTTFTIPTSGPGLYEFTQNVARWVSGDGVLTLFVRHTSCSLLIQENADPEVQSDLTEFFHRLVPPSTDPKMAYLTHSYEGPDDIPAHIKAALLQSACRFLLLAERWCWEIGKEFTFSNIEPVRTSARLWRK